MSGPARTPVRIIDPRGESGTGHLVVDEGGVRLDRDGGDGSAPRLAISPGWVDLHAHVFDGSTPISIAPDRVGLDHGVHLLADAGSAGEATVAGLRRYVVPSARTEVVAWLNIGSGGLVTLRETADAALIDVDATIEAVREHTGFVRGIKVRSSGAIVQNMGRQPLELGRLVARECGLPLLVHIGEAPPLVEDVLDLLAEGDSITHCFHGKTGRPWRADGSPVPALQRALDRGVRLDVGHGAASFDAGVARAAIRAGHHPHTVSTDVHVRNVDGPVFDLATVMTKMLDCEMPLTALIDAVTHAPRETLDLPEPWLGERGEVRHATLFEVSENAPGGRTYLDSVGTAMHPREHVVVRGVVTGGVVTGGAVTPEVGAGN